jgi:hypothetical protein
MEKHRNASPVNFKTIDNFDFAHVFFHVHYMFISSILGCWAVEKWCGGDRASKTANEVFWSAPEVSESGNCNWTGRSRGLGRHELRWCTQRHLVWALNALDLPWVFREQTIHFLVKPNGGVPNHPDRTAVFLWATEGQWCFKLRQGENLWTELGKTEVCSLDTTSATQPLAGSDAARGYHVSSNPKQGLAIG